MRNYAETLNLPRTDFPMKANLPEKEPQILQLWQGLYERLRERNKGKPVFVLHDGPPYANGHIHIGHALNKVLKDVIVKYKLLSGYDVDFVPGWDCHGLPIEQQVEKELKAKKLSKEELGRVAFRKLCREYASKFVEVQKEEFIRLGVIARWESPYITMDPAYQAEEIRELGRVFENNFVVRSKKPVYWCMHDKTAEAEAEVEYYEKEDPSIFVKFPLKDQKDAYLLIWTTTPWTLPANLGVMVGEEYDYVFFETEGGILILAKERLEELRSLIGLEGRVKKEVKGAELVGLEYFAPYGDRVNKIYPSEFVELHTGTGLVHMAPGHGREDYTVGLRYGLPAFAPVDEEGRFTQEAPEFIRGKRVFEANPLIIQDLRSRGLLLWEGKIKHAYPHCWRCKNPVIFRATPQWFISMSAVKEGKDLRQKSLEEVERVQWIPSFGKNRIASMLENRPDWCISRQRYWGVPITVFYCKNCGHVVAEREIFETIARLVESSEEGADLWFEKSERELLPEGYRCPACGSKEFRKEEDILDVWFDSGSSHTHVLRRRGIQKADLYLEGSDQHRGWFQASLLQSVASYWEAPYRAVLTHGFTVDEQGRKMSKSLGNVVSPQEVIKQYGADILRLWVVSEDYTEDIRLGKGILQRLVEDYKKIRNTIRFLLGNLYDFSLQKQVPFEELHHFDRWMFSYLQKVLKEVHKHYSAYAFHRIYHLIRNFCSVELSSIYLDVLKDRLYVYAPDSWERKSAQTVLYRLAHALITSVAPFLSFTAEEAWQHLRKVNPELPESVFMDSIPECEENHIDTKLLEDYEFLINLRDGVMKTIETARREKAINHPYEAQVFLWGDGLERVREYEEHLKYLFTVSQVKFAQGGDYRQEEGSIKVGVSRAEGNKCPRCWLYYTEDQFEGEVCKRCVQVLQRV
ncbi:MAG: isoleucine--tRNA ligase [Aquificaceae bacterium]|nr:isoleucine--tRNA ligase [Aquificaceae bacterium]